MEKLLTFQYLLEMTLRYLTYEIVTIFFKNKYHAFNRIIMQNLKGFLLPKSQFLLLIM